jgi:methylated-DNA-[protein]-cysteine S-methyltransferase
MTMTAERPDEDLTELFGFPPGGEELASLCARLVARAEDEGLLDLSYRTLASPLGTLLLAATPSGLVRVAYESEDLDAVLADLAAKISPRILQAPQRFDVAARQLEEYFTGRRRKFDLRLDLRLSAGFRRSVLAYLPAIGFGKTASYQAVAVAVRNPKAARAVGTACATNPLPIIIPCHRVIRSNGQLGPYLGGPDIKHKLLQLEGHR